MKKLFLICLMATTILAFDSCRKDPNNSGNEGEQKPIAGFSYTTSVEDDDLIVYCSNTSKNAESYYWKLVGPSPSENQDSRDVEPVFRIYTEGEYTLTLTATNQFGNDEIAQTINYRPEHVIADFTYTATNITTDPYGCLGVQIVNNSQNATSCYWNFIYKSSSGSILSSDNSSEENPYITLYGGSVTVKLIASNDDGRSDTKTIDIISEAIGFSVNRLYLTKIPMTDGGSAWDTGFETPAAPDIYFVIKDGTNIIYNSMRHDNVTNLPIEWDNIGLDFTPDKQYNVAFYDYDEITDDDLMVNGILNIPSSHGGYLTYWWDASNGSTTFKLDLRWLYKEIY